MALLFGCAQEEKIEIEEEKMSSKRTIQINNISDGINSDADPKLISENSVVDARNILLDRIGKIRQFVGFSEFSGNAGFHHPYSGVDYGDGVFSFMSDYSVNGILKSTQIIVSQTAINQITLFDADNPLNSLTVDVDDGKYRFLYSNGLLVIYNYDLSLTSSNYTLFYSEPTLTWILNNVYASLYNDIFVDNTGPDTHDYVHPLAVKEVILGEYYDPGNPWGPDDGLNFLHYFRFNRQWEDAGGSEPWPDGTNTVAITKVLPDGTETGIQTVGHSILGHSSAIQFGVDADKKLKFNFYLLVATSYDLSYGFLEHYRGIKIYVKAPDSDIYYLLGRLMSQEWGQLPVFTAWDGEVIQPEHLTSSGSDDGASPGSSYENQFYAIRNYETDFPAGLTMEMENPGVNKMK